MPLAYYHLRIHAAIEDPRYIDYAKQRTVEHILAKEGEDEECKRPHLHLHCQTYHNNDQAFRTEVLSRFSELWTKGNGSYSIRKKICNEIGYHYVCKGTGPDWDTGKPDILSTTFDEDQIKEFHRLFWAYNKPKVVINVPLELAVEDKKPRARAKQFTEKVAEELHTAYPDKLWDMEIDARFLVKYLYGKLGKIAKGFNQTKFNEMMNGIYAYLPKEHTVVERDLETLLVGYINRRF